MAATLSFTFWQPRRVTRVTDVSTRCTPCRMRTSSIMRPANASVNFQVRNFRLYGKLRKTKTEIHNSLPSIETIQTERSLTSFDQKRHSTPDNADYDQFYRALASSLTPHPSRLDTVRSSITQATSRSLDTRHGATFFPLTPAPLTSHSARSVTDSTCTRPVLPRLSSSYSIRLPESQRTVRGGGGGGGGGGGVGSESLGAKSISSKSVPVQGGSVG